MKPWSGLNTMSLRMGFPSTTFTVSYSSAFWEFDTPSTRIWNRRIRNGWAVDIGRKQKQVSARNRGTGELTSTKTEQRGGLDSEQKPIITSRHTKEGLNGSTSKVIQHLFTPDGIQNNSRHLTSENPNTWARFKTQGLSGGTAATSCHELPQDNGEGSGHTGSHRRDQEVKTPTNKVSTK